MSPESHDDLDRALAAGLGGLAPDADDVDGVLSAMRPRLRRARNRHRLVRASAAAGVFVVVGSAAFALAGPSNHHEVVSVAPLPSTTRSPATATSSTTRVSTTTVPSTPHPTTVTTVPNPRPSVPGGGGTPSTGSVPSTPTTTIAPSDLHTYRSRGGTLTVGFSSGRLTIVSYAAAAGYTAEVHRNDPDDVEVRFSGPDDRRIRIRVENGRLAPEIR